MAENKPSPVSLKFPRGSSDFGVELTDKYGHMLELCFDLGWKPALAEALVAPRFSGTYMVTDSWYELQVTRVGDVFRLVGIAKTPYVARMIVELTVNQALELSRQLD